MKISEIRQSSNVNDRDNLITKVNELKLGQEFTIDYSDDPKFLAKPETFVFNIQRLIYSEKVIKQTDTKVKTINDKFNKILTISRVKPKPKKK
jgi:hypothetical protein